VATSLENYGQHFRVQFLISLLYTSSISVPFVPNIRPKIFLKLWDENNVEKFRRNHKVLSLLQPKREQFISWAPLFQVPRSARRRTARFSNFIKSLRNPVEILNNYIEYEWFVSLNKFSQYQPKIRTGTNTRRKQCISIYFFCFLKFLYEVSDTRTQVKRRNGVNYYYISASCCIHFLLHSILESLMLLYSSVFTLVHVFATLGHHQVLLLLLV
jgi:hypothetical protein